MTRYGQRIIATRWNAVLRNDRLVSISAVVDIAATSSVTQSHILLSTPDVYEGIMEKDNA